MADPKKRLSTNVLGDFFVDSTCIDCDACRQIAPSVFAETGDYSSVYKQPASSSEESDAWHALLACPVGSIGCSGKSLANEHSSDFPLHVDGDVYYSGYNSKNSYGANSYFIKHPDGNWLIESPRFAKQLCDRLEELGGVSYIFLSHRDDVADASLYAEHFGSKRMIHKAELFSQPASEIVIDGTKPVEVHPDFLVVPTPGHTQGHCVLLYQKKYLFTGDHVYWNRAEQNLAAFERYCWYSWDEQKASMKTLMDYKFEWVLPGHGQRVHLSAEKMHKSLARLVKSM